MYPSTTLFVALGQFAIVVLVLFSYPLQVHPCRNCLDKVFASTDFAAGKVITPPEDDDDDDDEDGTTIETELLHGGGADMTPLKHTLLTSGIVVFGFLTAYIVDDLQLGEFCREISPYFRFCLTANTKCYHLWDLRGLPPYRSSCLVCSTLR